MEKRETIPSHAAQALQAHNSRKQSGQSKAPETTEEITSLNRLLQWATANTEEKEPTNEGATTLTTTTASTETNETKKKSNFENITQADREWLDAAFPDVYEGLREIVKQLDSEKPDERIDALSDLQEFLMDLNYATNIDKFGALDPLIRLSRPDEGNSTEERSLAIWCLGTASQHLNSIKLLLISNDVHLLIANTLSDPSTPPQVLAKAVMASSALLRDSSDEVIEAFEEAGGMKGLRLALSNDHVGTRKKVRFFYAHCGNAKFVDDLIYGDGYALGLFIDSLKRVDVDDYADCETAMDAVKTVIERDVQKVLQVGPELPGNVDELLGRCTDEDIRDIIQKVAGKLP